MDDKNDHHYDKLVFVVHVVPINEKSMPYVTIIYGDGFGITLFKFSDKWQQNL
jgi:hypothetical protein